MKKGELKQFAFYLSLITWQAIMFPFRIILMGLIGLAFLFLFPIQILLWSISKASFSKTQPYFSLRKYFLLVSPAGWMEEFEDDECNILMVIFCSEIHFAWFWKIFIQEKKYRLRYGNFEVEDSDGEWTRL